MKKYREKLKNIVPKGSFHFFLGLFTFSLFVFNLSPAEAATIARPMNNSGLVAYYDFDAGKGGSTLYDRSGNERNGTLNSMEDADWQSGYVGGALVFDGSAEYVSFTNTAGLPYTASARTMCAWLRPDSTSAGHHYAVSYGAGSTDSAFFIGRNGATLVGGGYANDVTISNFWSTGVWNHVCLSYDGTTATLWTNGSFGISAAKAWDTSGSLFRIGRQVNDSAEYWDGAVDDVRIYDRALSDSEIKRLYNFSASKISKTPTVIENGLAAHWTFDGQNINYNTANEIIDRVGGNNGNARSTPVIETFAAFSDADSTTTAPLTMPSGVTAGNLLVAKLCWGNGTAGWADATATGWTKLNSTNVGTNVGSGVWYRFADGTEGASQTFTGTNSLSAITAITMRISAAGVPQMSSTVTGGDANPDAPSFSPEGVPNDYLWLVVAATNGDNTFTADPAGYTEVDQQNSGDDECTSYVAERSTTAVSTEDPGAATYADTWDWMAWTIAVPPPPLVLMPGRVGQALAFEGNDCVTFGDAPAFRLTDSYTLSAWVKTTAVLTAFERIHGVYTVNTPRDIDLDFWNNNMPTLFDRDDGVHTITLSSNRTINDGHWHLVTATRSGDNYRIYIDGTSANSTQNSSNLAETNTRGWAIGCAGRDNATVGEFFDGTIDDVRIYDRALSADEVKRLYDATRPSGLNLSRTTGSLSDGLVRHWTFDGSVTNSVVTKDIAGNTSGSLVSSPLVAIGQIGQGLNFNGSSSYVNGGSPPTMTEWTIAAWANADVGGNAKNILSNDRSGWNDDVLFGIRPEGAASGGADNRWGVTHQDTTNQVRTSALDSGGMVTGRWYHVVAWSDGNNLKLFVDGVEKASTPKVGTALTFDGAATRIAATPNVFRGFDGKIDDVRIYDRPLSADEIKRLYNLGL